MLGQSKPPTLINPHFNFFLELWAPRFRLSHRYFRCTYCVPNGACVATGNKMTNNRSPFEPRPCSFALLFSPTGACISGSLQRVRPGTARKDCSRRFVPRRSSAPAGARVFAHSGRRRDGSDPARPRECCPPTPASLPRTPCVPSDPRHKHRSARAGVGGKLTVSGAPSSRAAVVSGSLLHLRVIFPQV